MADARISPPADDAEVFVSASEDEAVTQVEEVQQVITPELLSALVKQVEFYFSDANLPTDKKLLKQIRKDPEGFVPVKLFANFRKVRALSKDVSIITEALRSASLLQLSQDGKRVRRIMPVPEYDISDIQRRTIVVENLPGNPSPTIESVTDMFRVFGRVKLVRICSRESKGKLPSWLTSSCQHMGGIQHAYVEFEEEEGAILASAALAQDADAPDGVVQVRRLLACIAEQRERRSVTGAGSSFGGSSGGGSRKGSRDVSPMGSRNANSRRGSGGGVPYANSAYLCSSNAWTSSSAGGAAPDSYHPAFHLYRSYGGAFEHGGVSRSGSGGGACPSPSIPFMPPPPPPPPRRSCDSAPVSDLLQGAVSSTAAALEPLGSGRPANVYRPPAKRLSDGYHCGFQPSPVGNPSAGVASAVPLPLQRCMGGSLGSSCGSVSTVPVSSGSTPTAAPSSPPPILNAFINAAANSPPLATRTSSSGGGRPPVHPAVVPPPPPPPPPKPQHSAIEPPSTIASVLHPAKTPMPVTVSPAAVPPPPSALAEAIAHVQAERRASESGVSKGVVVAATVADAVLAPAMVPVTSTSTPRAAPTAPKFRLDLSAVVPNRPSRGTASQDGSHSAGTDSIVKAVPAPLPRGSQTQMVANVEDFINNILAGRPAPRPTPAHSNGSLQPRKAAAAAAAAAPRTQATAQQPQLAVDAAVAVASIIASTFRRPNPAAAATGTATSTSIAAATVSVPGNLSAPKATVSNAEPQPIAESQPAVIAPAANRVVAEVSVPGPVLPSFPEVYLTAVSASDGADFSLEHAVTVTIHRAPAGSATAAMPLDCVQKSPTSEVSLRGVANAAAPVVAYASSGSSTTSSAPSSPSQLVSKGPATKGGGGGKAAAGQAQVLSARGSGGAQAGAKRLSRRDYAQWAAATPEFRAEAVSKYSSSNTSGSPSSTAGGFGRSSGGGAATAGSCGPASPSVMAAVSISDGGVFGTAVPSGPSSAGHYHSTSTVGPIWHVAKGPDGSKGFAGRARVLAA